MQVNPFYARRILSDSRIRPTKKRGQHFIVDPKVVEKQVDYANLKACDLVFEIGAGLGALTEAIASRGNCLVTIEIDDRLVRLVAPWFEEHRNVSLIKADALSFVLKRVDKIISNIPYNLSSQITFRLLDMEFKTAILSYQIDFAKRMIAKPGSRDYGRLSVNVYYRAKAEIVEIIPRNAFFPMPSVESAMVRLEHQDPPFVVDDESFFSRILREIFSHRNQLLRKVLKRFLRANGLASIDAMQILKDAKVEDKRIVNIEPESIARLSNTLGQSIKKLLLTDCWT